MRYVISYTPSEAVAHACTSQEELDAVVAGSSATHVELDEKCDLSNVPLPVLARLYNRSAPAPIQRFRDRATAEARVRPLIPQLAVPADSGGVVEPEPAAKRPGVIATIRALLDRPEGVTVDEAVSHLTEVFPDRRAEGMATTVRIQFHRLARTTGRQVLSEIEGDRGRVYRFVS